MTAEDLRRLIAGGENLAVEFKGEERQALSDGEIVDAVVCLANRSGDRAPGWLLVGVEDDGRVTGARGRHGDRTDPLRLQALISNRTRPAVSARVEVFRLADNDVIVVEVPSVRTPVGTTDGRYLRRALGGDGKPSCVPLHFHEMQTQQADRGILDYTSLVLPDARWEDLDPLEFERFRRFIRENPGQGDASLLGLADQEMAKALGAVEANHVVSAVRVLGVLLFGREESVRRLLPVHEVAFQVLSGLEVEVNDFFRWPLLRVMDELLSHFRVRRREREVMVGFQRIGVPNYSGRAYREAIANALIHRDYTRLGTVHVQWHDDRIEVSSPGGFPEGVRLDNLLVTAPQPRNPLLADAFKRAGVVERTARGIDTIFYEQLRSGHRLPSYERSNERFVVLVLPGGEADLAFARLVAEEGHADRPLLLDDLLLLEPLAAGRRLDAIDAARRLQKPKAEAVDRLERLAEVGLVRKDDPVKDDPEWQLSADARRRLAGGASDL